MNDKIARRPGIKRTIWLSLVCSTAMTPLPALAQVSTWTGATSNDWTVAGNWTPAGPPGAASNVSILTGSPILTGAATVNTVGIAWQNGSTASLIVSGPGASLATGPRGAIEVIGRGIGSFRAENGAQIVSGGLGVGTGFLGVGESSIPGADASAVFTGRGTSGTFSNALFVGGIGPGSLLIADGASVTSGQFTTIGGFDSTINGLRAHGPGRALVTGAGSSFTASGTLVGYFGRGEMTIADGAKATFSPWSAAPPPIGGSALLIGSPSYTGTLTGNPPPQQITINSSAIVTVTGAGTAVTVNGDISMIAIPVPLPPGEIITRLPSEATLNVADRATMSVAGEIQVTGDFSGDKATINIGTGGLAGILTATRIAGNAGQVVVNFNHTDDISFSVPMEGRLTVNQMNAGRTTLTGASSYAGLTTVSAGTLQAGATGAFSPNSDFNVSAGALDLNGINQTVRSLANAGLVATNLAGGTPGTTLTVTGDYAGAGGTVRLNSQLGADASPTDRLVVNGATSGTGILQVINRGGLGAQTVEGIKIVDVGGASNGTFTLSGDYVFRGAPAVIGGAYAYQLYKGGVSTPGDGDWYLRSTLINPPTPQPPKPLYQPGVPLYEAYAQVLSQLNGLPTLQQRVGNRTWAGGDGTTASPAGEGWAAFDRQGLWGRIEGGLNRFSPAASTSGTSFTSNLWRAQIGLDGRLVEAPSGSLVGGVTAHYGEISARVGSLFGDGSIRSQGYGFGGTLTWYGQNGVYVDAQAQATWFDSKLNSETLSRTMNQGRNGGFGYAFGLEAGRRFAIAPQMALTPQAQLIYSSVRFDRFTDPYGARVSLDRGESLRGRFGLAIDHEQAWRDAAGAMTRSRVYGIANLTYEFLDGMRTDVSGTKLLSRGERLMGGVGVGGTYSWAEGRYALYGEGTIDTSLNRFGDSYAIRGTVGFRHTW